MRDCSGAGHAPATTGKVLHWAPFYDALAFLMTFGREKQIRRETVQRAGVAPAQSVLDVGCGTGSLTLAAKAAAGPGGKVCGIDPSPEMIKVARRKAARARAEIDFQPGVVEDLAFPDASFDVVLSSLMLHHLPDDVKRKGFAEIARVLKPGGVFFAVDLAGGSPSLASHLFGRRSRHGAGSLDAAAPMLAAAGFKDITTGQMKFKMLSYVSARRGAT